MQTPLVPRVLALLLLLCLAAGTSDAADNAITVKLEQQPWRGDLDGMIKRRVIRALVPYSKTLYFVDLGGAQRGISHDFMRAFETDLNKRLNLGNLPVHVVFIPVSREQLLPWLLAGKGDVVAANLTVTPARSREVAFAVPGARDVRELIVTGPGAPPLQRVEDLAGKELYIGRATSYYETLSELNRQFARRGLPPMKLREAPGNFETEDILEMVNAGLVKITLADHYLARLWRQVYTHLTVREDLALRSGGDIAFAVRRDSPQLKARLDAFTAAHSQGTLFGNVTLNKYLQNTRWVKNATSEAELAKFTTLVTLFRKYGREYDVDWLLVAAQGYQESQLDQQRRSHVGAIGVMQVMPATGKELNVGDITKLEPNIHAGVKYIRFMVDTYYRDERMDGLNKALFAFAAYNAGPNRIRGLRRQAQAEGLNPNLWFDNVERVVAREVGRETVQYVSNIYKYYIAYSLVQDDVEQGLRKQQRQQ